MSAITQIQQSDIPAAGAPIGGGFAVATYREGDKVYLLIDSGKAGDLRGKWGEYGKEIVGARSYADGLANTIALAEADSPIAKAALGLRIADYDDWHLPARDQQELQYRYLKPTSQENYCSFRDGENPSALPLATYPYTEEAPTQTTVAAYQAGGSEAFSPEWHWSSTQSSALSAWIQSFVAGLQYGYGKTNEFAARAVRRILVIQ